MQYHIGVLGRRSTTAAAQTRSNGFFLTTPLMVGGGYEQNLFTGASQLDDTAAILTGPTMEWIRDTHRMDFFVNFIAGIRNLRPTFPTWTPGIIRPPRD